MTRRGPTPLLTVWGEALDPDAPLPEYPRPQLVRDSYLNLNGRWDYAITRSDAEPTGYDGRIVVPFSPESLLSGVERVLQPDEVLHYRRPVRLPDGFRSDPDDRLLLHFGAVDRWCRVVVDGCVVGEHDGGYLPFSLDVTEALSDGDQHVLTVVVRDPSDSEPGSRGKQRLKRGGIWYTPQSGIWQTVWLESVPPVRIGRLSLVPDLPAGTLDVTAHVAGPPDMTGDVTVTVTAAGEEVGHGTGSPGRPIRVALDLVRPWTPEDPYLYDLEITMGRDTVRSYAGLRSFGIGHDRDGHPRLLLNGRPYLHLGVLDQGYWSDGMYTPPADAAMVHDIETMKDLGFTMLRKHVKVEPLRWYHHCDRIGMLVWQDVVNGGGRYHPAVISAPAFLPVRLRDNRYDRFARSDAADRSRWLDEMRETVDLLGNVVGLAAWVPFNEGWGQFDSAAAARELQQRDPTRQVDHASGWHDQGAGDLVSRHVYVRRFRMPRHRAGTRPRAVALTEYGGYSHRIDGHSASGRSFGYRLYRSPERLAAAFRALHERQVLPAVAQGLSATVYTQLSDVEDETNGLLTYDRRVLKIPADVVRAVTARLRAAADR